MSFLCALCVFVVYINMERKKTTDQMPEFKALGHRVDGPSRNLETFPKPEHVSLVKFTSQELTSACPITHQPDFYTVEILYRPTLLCLESKSLKLYLWSFRDETMFAETLAHLIAKDVAAATQSSYCKVTLLQQVRGGLRLEVIAEVGNGA